MLIFVLYSVYLQFIKKKFLLNKINWFWLFYAYFEHEHTLTVADSQFDEKNEQVATRGVKYKYKLADCKYVENHMRREPRKFGSVG